MIILEPKPHQYRTPGPRSVSFHWMFERMEADGKINPNLGVHWVYPFLLDCDIVQLSAV